MKTTQLIKAYYEAFNKQDRTAILALLTEDVIHDINQGGREVGKNTFFFKADLFNTRVLGH